MSVYVPALLEERPVRMIQSTPPATNQTKFSGLRAVRLSVVNQY
jgi:hypothetical protein